MNRCPRILGTLLVAGLVIAGSAPLFVSGCSKNQIMLSVNIGTTTSEVNSLILFAREHGYFEDNELKVVPNVYSSGVAALEGLANGEVDIVTGSEFAFANNVLSGKDICALANICRSSIEYIVCRTDSGITQIGDLRGKAIGVPMGSRPEFALSRFLYFNGIGPLEVNLVDVPVGSSAQALASGQVDAVATWQPYIDQTKEQLDGGTLTWSVQEEQPSYTLLMGRKTWVVENPELVTRFLKSLIRAEKSFTANPEPAKEFIADETGYPQGYIENIWPDYRFNISLDQPLVIALEDQARWIIDQDPESGLQTPNFLKNLYLAGLEEVKPEAVTIIY